MDGKCPMTGDELNELAAIADETTPTPAISSSRQRIRKEPQMRWAIDVWVDGEEVLAIEPDSVSGKATFTAEETQAIREAARSLMAFIGEEDTPWLDPDEPQPE